MAVLVFIPILLWVYFVSKIDADHILKGEYILDHNPRFISRLMVGLIVGLLDWKAGLLVGVTFWVFFDTMLSLLRGLRWDYIGSVAATDLFFKKYPIAYYLSKAVGVIAIMFLIGYSF